MHGKIKNALYPCRQEKQILRYLVSFVKLNPPLHDTCVRSKGFTSIRNGTYFAMRPEQDPTTFEINYSQVCKT